MTTRIRKLIAAAAATVCAAGAVLVSTAGNTAAQPATQEVFAITGDGGLMAAFYINRPQILNWVRAVTGLSGDAALVAIDVRVQDGLLYGLGDQGGIYAIRTPPQVDDVKLTKVSQLQVPLYGTEFDIDFNPAADRLRVISDNGQNLRHNLHDHSTVEDGTLTVPPSLAAARGVTAAAYTNNDLDPGTATTLLDISTVLDQVLIQSPPNEGKLVATGALGVNAGLDAGFDIYSDLSGGKTVSVAGYAALVPVSGPATFYSVNLFTGAVAPVGAFPLNITDIAVALDTNP
ncbi:DUF4394 domain-containing protein [Actinophytocola sediminis]